MEDRVGVLLRVDDPDDRVHEGQHPVHLLAVRDGRRVVVGQVHQDEPAQLGLHLGALQGASAQPSRDAEPVDEGGRAVAPAARDGRGGGGPSYARLRNGHSGERVEQLGLAAAGGAGDGDHGVLPGEPAPRGRLVEDPSGLGEGAAVEPGAGESHEFPQGVETRAQRPVVRQRGRDVRDMRGVGRLRAGGPDLQGGGLLRGGGLVDPSRDQPVVPGPGRFLGVHRVRGSLGLRTAGAPGVGRHARVVVVVLQVARLLRVVYGRTVTGSCVRIALSGEVLSRWSSWGRPRPRCAWRGPSRPCGPGQ